MKMFLFLTIYNIVYPLFLFLSLPGYLIKMYRRGGYGTGLLERFGYYRIPLDSEPQGGVYVHAVSVGEALIALKWIKEWQKDHTEPVVLATSTSTGHAVALEHAPKGVRVLYSPLDLPGLPGRCLARFNPVAIVLIEAELWPNMALAARKRGIPHVMINARLSDRSEARYRKILPVTKLFFSFLDGVGVQDERDAERFAGLGIPRDRITVTGSVKFDNYGVAAPARRDEFVRILAALSGGRPVVLAASTHFGEEVLIASAIRHAGGFPLIVPRHAERRATVVSELAAEGWVPILRSEGDSRWAGLTSWANVCYIADTTGELRDWTAHADLVVIGKSFLAEGGQNPAEAVAAGVPVIAGPHMENFRAFVEMLERENGITRCAAEELPEVLSRLLSEEVHLLQGQAERAKSAFAAHNMASLKSVRMVEDSMKKVSLKR